MVGAAVGRAVRPYLLALPVLESVLEIARVV